MSENPRHKKQFKYFESLLVRGLLGHAYLLVGQKHINSIAFAENICELLTGRGFENNPNLKLLQPDREKERYKIQIEDVRGLKSFMSLKPHSSQYKLAVINDADVMTIEAANAMLKILEEPPKQAVIILVTSKPKSLPTTILSRCETVVFPPSREVETDEMIKALAELRRVARQSIAERIKYAKKIYEGDSYTELVNLWLRSLRLQLVGKPTSVPVLKNLLRLSQIISQPQYNHRIALETFFINL